MADKDLKLKDTIILFDRDLGLSVYRNFRGYNDLMDDAEWLLERTPQKSRGFLIRPVSKSEQDGIWVGEYDQRGNQINRQEFILGNGASALNRLVSGYAERKIAEKRFMNRIAIENLKRNIRSRIIRDFRYYVCPIDHFYRSCTHIEKAYAELTKKYGKGRKIPCSRVTAEIEKTKPCKDVIVCPLMAPNLFERVLNLNKALKGRKLGEIRFVTSDLVEIT